MNKVKFKGIPAHFNVTNEQDHIQKCWLSGNFYETGRNQLLTWCYNNLPQGMNILDIGANVGNHSIFFSKVMQANRVYAIEPYLKNFVELVENIHLNSCANILPLNVAAYCENDIKNVILKDENNCGMVEFSNVGQAVVCCELDNVIDEQIDYIKIDVEGCELDALDGCKDIVNIFRPVVSVETDETATVSFMLPDYQKLPITLNHTETHVWKPS